MQLTEALITHLIQKLSGFRQRNPLITEEQTLYEKAPVEQMARTFLKIFLEPERTDQAATELAQTALSHQLPYAVLLGDINAIKHALYEHYRAQDDNPLDLFERLDTAFETAKQAIARVYLLKTAEENGLFPAQNRLKTQLLLALYDEWFLTLREALQSLNLDQFEAISARNAQFDAALTYPETLMVCMDAQACHEVESIHRNIMRQTGLLYLKLLDERYEQAYLMYLELRASIKQIAALLTTLYFNYETNRISVFFKFLETAASATHTVEVALINPKGLARINQLHDENIGDTLLAQLEDRLSRLCRDNREHLSYVRGLQGDFYLVSMNASDEQLTRWYQQLTEPLRTDEGIEVAVALSSAPLNDIRTLNGSTLRMLIQYLRQQTTTRIHRLNRAEDSARLNDWLVQQLEERINLRALIEGGKVEAHAQPLVDLHNGQAFAFELLGRLRTEQGLISAGAFIDRLVELNLTEAFDRVMLDAIVREAPRLRELTRTVFINVSPASLKSEAYLQALRAAFDDPLQGLDVVLELTEQTLLDQLGTIRALHERYGMTFAIDDFGTGYSSLMTVIDLAQAGIVRYLKIDGSLTRRLDGVKDDTMESVFEIIQALSDRLKLVSVAEFIENDKVEHQLDRIGIRLGQGYALGRPQPIRAWLVLKRLGELSTEDQLSRRETK